MRDAPDNLVAHDLRGVSPARLEEVRNRNFGATMDLVCAYHPFYRDLFAREKIDRRHFLTPGDLAIMPVTTKSDFADDPERFHMRIDTGPAEWRTLWDVMYSSGTSGEPAPFYSTTYDYYNTLTASRRMLDLRGATGEDVIANLNPMTVYPNGAYHRTLHAAATIGAAMFSPLPGNASPWLAWGRRLDEVVAMIARRRTTILWGITSYVHRVVKRAVEVGADLSGVRLAFVSGEATSEAMRADIVAMLTSLGAVSPRVSISYGQTETQSGMVECRDGSGLHNPMPEGFLWEAVDPHTHEQVEDGDEGLALVSHLDRRGTLVLRYALGDMITLDRRPCPFCGAVGERVRSPRRADGRLKIKGALVDSGALVEAVVQALPGVTFQIVVDHLDRADPLSGDQLRIEVDAAMLGSDALKLATQKVKQQFQITPEIDALDSGASILDDANKLRRFIDRRRPA